MHITTREEVERCLPYFVRLCVERVVEQGTPLDLSALEIARIFHQRCSRTVTAELQPHFTAALSEMVDLVSALGPRLPPDRVAQFVEQTSAAQVAEALERSLREALRSDGATAR